MALPRRKKAFFLACLLLLIALSVEGLARLYVVWRWQGNFSAYDQKEGMYQFHPFFVYELKPNLDFSIMGRFHVQTNSAGFRGPEIAKEKKPGVFRIVCLGGSTTFDTYATDNDHTYPRLLESYLADAIPTRQIEVLNAGVPGYTSAESLAAFEFKLLDYSPDLIIVLHGYNDTLPLLHEDYQPDYGSYRSKPVSNIQDSILYRYSILFRILYFKMKSNVSNAALKTPEQLRAIAERNGTAAFQRNMRTLFAICRHRNIAVVACSQKHVLLENDPLATVEHDIVEQLNKVTKETAAEFDNAAFFDLASLLDEKQFVDNVHQNDAGNSQRATIIGEFLIRENLLAR